MITKFAIALYACVAGTKSRCRDPWTWLLKQYLHHTLQITGDVYNVLCFAIH